MFHLQVTHIFVLIDIEHLMIVFVFLLLVKYTQYLCQTVVYPSMQERNLYDYAVVCKAFHKRVGHAVCHLIAVIVIRFVTHVKYRLLDVAHTVTEQIHGNHRYGISVRIIVFFDIVRIDILCAEILAEAQRLRFQPRFLQLNEHKLQTAVLLSHLCSEIYAEHRDFVAATVGILMLAHVHLHHLFLK